MYTNMYNLVAYTNELPLYPCKVALGQNQITMLSIYALFPLEFS